MISARSVYPTNRPNPPTAIFIHVGAWRASLARNYGFCAELMLGCGAHLHLLVPDFAAVQHVNGHLAMLADQLKRAVVWVYEHAARFDGDAQRIHVQGHSSGAHLAGVVLTTGWASEFGLPQDLIKSGLCCSGIFDLKPVRLSARSSYVHLNGAYGTLKTLEFQRQSRDLAADC